MILTSAGVFGAIGSCEGDGVRAYLMVAASYYFACFLLVSYAYLDGNKKEHMLRYFFVSLGFFMLVN